MVVLTGCPPPCEYSLIEYGTLSDEAINCSPYVDGQSYSLIHSGGQKLTFFTSRVREMRTEYWDDCTEMRHESDVTTLTPAYPLFPCYIGIHKTSTTEYDCNIVAGGSNFWFPPSTGTDYGHTYFDSIQFGQNWYREVYKTGNSWWDGNPEGQILADSIYYNTSHGILKILMTNGEFYEITE